ncbi:Arc family DNA-binding protein [Aeromonas veronii]|uniref:Arc family DNA-binding protein n=1 Tax=Aeromonas veronii TaxID=654 RepID=UPI00223C84FA|nr:Arc family DNA-binding protein [Aeromonas veronii]
MKKSTAPTGRASDKFMLRLPDGMRDTISELAKASGRSMNAEIVHRLQQSIDASLTGSTNSGPVGVILDAVHLNPGIVDLRPRQSHYHEYLLSQTRPGAQSEEDDLMERTEQLLADIREILGKSAAKEKADKESKSEK